MFGTALIPKRKIFLLPCRHDTEENIKFDSLLSCTVLFSTVLPAFFPFFGRKTRTFYQNFMIYINRKNTPHTEVLYLILLSKYSTYLVIFPRHSCSDRPKFTYFWVCKSNCNIAYVINKNRLTKPIIEACFYYCFMYMRPYCSSKVLKLGTIYFMPLRLPQAVNYVY